LGTHIGNIGNLLGIHWELEENIEGTCWEQRKNEKKSRHLECMLQPTHWLHVFLDSKTVGHHFWPRLMAEAEIEQGRKTKKQILPSHPRKKKPGPIMSAC
jgi:hypothetical protein